jgi:hypothetical protein
MLRPITLYLDAFIRMFSIMYLITKMLMVFFTIYVLFIKRPRASVRNVIN